jgi:hypothetical protein
VRNVRSRFARNEPIVTGGTPRNWAMTSSAPAPSTSARRRSAFAATAASWTTTFVIRARHVSLARNLYRRFQT